MKYSDILEAHLKYGTTSLDIIKRNNYQEILNDVVVAPWWSHEIFNSRASSIEQVGNNIFNVYGDGFSFSFIELNQISSSFLIERVLPLGVTKCKRIIFIGSVGALDENIKIGDLIVPKYSICCDGASRYLNRNLEDCFGEDVYPDKHFTDLLLDVIKSRNLKYHYVPNCSVDTIFGQFPHIDRFIEMGAKTIEMETAALFKCCFLMNIASTAILCVSDNTIVNKSLFSGRNEEENKYRYFVKEEVIPEIVCEMFKKN